MSTQAIDNVTFVQRVLLSAWNSVNSGEIEENAYDMRRSLDFIIKNNSGFHKKDESGNQLEVNINALESGNSVQLAEGGTYPLINKETMRGAQWPWVLTNTATVYTFEELGENQGRTKLIDNVKSRTRVSMQDHFKAKNFQFLRGTGTVPSSQSLNTLVGTTDNGNVAVASFPTWIGYVDTTSQNLSAFVIDKAIDATMFDETNGIDFLLSGPTLFQRWKQLGANSTTIFQPSDKGTPDTLYTGPREIITFRNALWYWDRMIPDANNTSKLGDTTNYLYGIDSNTMFAASVKGAWNTPLELVRSIDQLMHHFPIVSRYNFGTLARRSAFKLTNVGTS